VVAAPRAPIATALSRSVMATTRAAVATWSALVVARARGRQSTPMKPIASLASVGACVILLGGVAPARAESPPAERTWSVPLEACQEPTAVSTTASGHAVLVLPHFGAQELQYSISFGGFAGVETAAHIHGPAARGQVGPILFTLPAGSPKSGSFAVTPEVLSALVGGQLYIDIHSSTYPDGELRGQIDDSGSACPPPVDAGVDGGLICDGGWVPSADANEGSGSGSDGCAAGGGRGSLALVAAIGALLVRRRRR